MTRTPRMDQIESLLKDDPTDPFLHYGLAMEHASVGDDHEAGRILQKLIDQYPENPYIPAYLQLGQLLIRLGKDEEASQILKTGIVKAEELGDQHAAAEMLGFLSTI